MPAKDAPEGSLVYISRLQVEGGDFFQHLDLYFGPGLTTLIGARGTGKTSIIELIRFCLGAKSYTSEEGAISQRHALGVLGTGEVTVTLTDGLEEIVVSRSGDDPEPVASEVFAKPIVFSQKEIESIGLTPSGRLSLIDGFRTDRLGARRRELGLLSSVASLQAEIVEAERSMSELQLALPAFTELAQRETAALAEQVRLTGTSGETAEKQGRLSLLSEELAQVSQVAAAVERFGDNARAWRERLEAGLSSELATEGSGLPIGTVDPLATWREPYKAAVRAIAEAAETFRQIGSDVERVSIEQARRRALLEGSSRSIRSEVDELVKGAGAVERQLASVRKQIADGRATEATVSERVEKLRLHRQRRDLLLGELDDLWRARFDQRRAIAERLNEQLRPQVMVSVAQSAQFGEYARAIAEKLRGTGLRYNDAAALIAERVSPRELARWAEDGDAGSLSEATGLTVDRAQRVLAALLQAGLGEILTVKVEDGVSITFLDNTQYKDVIHLSAGQRCTAILPLVLQHYERVVIIDQPEDHIDNAYIANTIVEALRARPTDSQLIVSTHNANIPVLGEATLVVELSSDGRSGSVRVAEPVAHADSVDAITSIMEGGEPAFNARAEFYRRNSL